MRYRILCLGLVLFTGTLWAQEHHHGDSAVPAAGGHLGAVHFTNSCAAGVQEKFNKGVALLHSFQYMASNQVFEQVAAEDSSCAVAYWGEAMTLWHELWERPDAATLKTGHDKLQKAAELAAGATPREREYIAAAGAFFQTDPALDFKARSTAYSTAMAQIYQDYPDDGEAAAFYALSLIAMPAEGDADLANRRKAIEVLNPLFASQPDHPGAAHYLIHSCDVPELAPQGLAAARRYAQIAPDSSHALHMPSHIFSRLGLWQESVQSNLAAAAAAAEATKAHTGEAHYQLHALDYLEYAYLQQRRDADAAHVIDEVRTVMGATPDEIKERQAAFRARYALETHNWRMADALDVPDVALYEQQTTWWAKALGSARIGSASAARAAIEKLNDATAEGKARSKKEGYEVKDTKNIHQLEAEAWLDYVDNDVAEALKTLRAAADRQDAEGAEDLEIPAREMLGDMLVASRQPEAALVEYRAALKGSPNRLGSLEGVELAGKAAKNHAPISGSK